MTHAIHNFKEAIEHAKAHPPDTMAGMVLLRLSDAAAILEEVERKQEGHIRLRPVFIPNQKCPICEGTGQIYVQQMSEGQTAIITTGWQTCHKCGGQCTIPMIVEPPSPAVDWDWDDEKLWRYFFNNFSSSLTTPQLERVFRWFKEIFKSSTTKKLG